MRRGSFQQKPRKPLKRTPLKARKRTLRIAGVSTTTEIKKEIQALLRQIVMIRDGGCILRHYCEAGACGPIKKDGNPVLQAEHLITRSNSGTFGDSRNCVCLCQRHHIYWKPQYSDLYWEMVKSHLPEKTWKWYEVAKLDTKAYRVDWKLVKIALEQELKTLTTKSNNGFPPDRESFPKI